MADIRKVNKCKLFCIKYILTAFPIKKRDKLSDNHDQFRMATQMPSRLNERYRCV